MKSCDNCRHCNATPVLPPCEDWEYCVKNNFCYFQSNFLCKTKNVFVKKKKTRRRIKVKKKTNPYPKYSYNSGICYADGSPCWGIDNKWLMFEIKQGNGLSQLKWEDKDNRYNYKRGNW